MREPLNNSSPRCVYVGDRAHKVLDFCREPQSMADIMAKFGAEQARFAVYNLVKRERMVNLNAGQGRAVPGLFVAASEAATKRAYMPAPRSDGSELALAWRRCVDVAADGLPRSPSEETAP